MVKYFHSSEPFLLEHGGRLSDLTVAYHTYGTFVRGKTPVLWVCHGLTANSDVADWWQPLFGKDTVLDPERYFIVCATMLGSPYGSSSPLSVNARTGESYGRDFPLVSIRDNIRAFNLLRTFLDISEIEVLIGASLGGHCALEWSLMEREVVKKVVFIATSAKHSAWGIAWNEAQRMAIQASGGTGAGLAAARAIAMLSYRNYAMYSRTEKQSESSPHYGAAEYQRYQGEKLVQRFDANCYVALTHTMDSHNIGRNRAGVAEVLASVTAETAVIGITTDILFPTAEQRFLAANIPNARYFEIDSAYGHDGFLTEHEQLRHILMPFFSE